MQRIRLDRFISAQFNISRRDVRLMLAQKRIEVNGIVVSDIGQIVDKFSQVSVDNQLLQQNTPRYIMLHKPVGVVSATKDELHQTVIDLLDSHLIDGEEKDSLHIVGRLDLNTSGLILLTNDSRWSKRLTQPDQKVAKEYIVTLDKPLSPDYIEAFAKGMYFSYEDITTRPAQLEILDTYRAKVILMEGRYHQIKRMFGRFRNPVLKLHRSAIGTLQLPSDLPEGQSRELTRCEVKHIAVEYAP